MATTIEPIARTFEIRSGQRRVRSTSDHVHFAFGDLRFSYACHRNGSKCCGYEHSLSGNTKIPYQLSIHPDLNTLPPTFGERPRARFYDNTEEGRTNPFRFDDGLR